MDEKRLSKIASASPTLPAGAKSSHLAHRDDAV
jgi:hypothetical protein